MDSIPAVEKSISYPRRFFLRRDTDVSGVSGTGVVAEGMRWISDWPTSVVFHGKGIESVMAIHGHGGSTKIIFLDGETK